MKRRIRHILFLLLVAVNVVSVAQEKRIMSREMLDSLMSPKLMPNGGQVFRFDTLQLDFGVIYETDAPLTMDYGFVNVSGKSVTITRVTTNCGCTVAEIGDSLLVPDERGVIRIMFNPRGRSGTVDTNTFVYTSLSDREPVAKLTLLGNVIDNDEWNHLPCSMGALRLKRKEVVFESMKAGTFPQQRIACANVGTVPLKLSSVLLPPYISLSTQPAEIAPGEEGDIVITINADMLPSNASRSFNVVVSGVDGRISDRTLNVKLEK
ncbi:MAG: DUF1573 domain-containing protein [Bacteroidaceae bacterium]|nr:DUF1573 domain-containing protein [Bacteroidaceae bacterium]